MSREFPRFITANPITPRGKGPFIAHLIFPHAVFKVFPKLINPSEKPLKEKYTFVVYGNKFNTALLECDDCPHEQKQELTETAHAWYANQPVQNLQ